MRNFEKGTIGPNTENVAELLRILHHLYVLRPHLMTGGVVQS